MKISVTSNRTHWKYSFKNRKKLIGKIDNKMHIPGKQNCILEDEIKVLFQNSSGMAKQIKNFKIKFKIYIIGVCE